MLLRNCGEMSLNFDVSCSKLEDIQNEGEINKR